MQSLTYDWMAAADSGASLLAFFRVGAGGGVTSRSRRRFWAFALIRSICALSSAVNSSAESISTTSGFPSANREHSCVERRSHLVWVAPSLLDPVQLFSELSTGSGRSMRRSLCRVRSRLERRIFFLYASPVLPSSITLHEWHGSSSVHERPPLAAFKCWLHLLFADHFGMAQRRHGLVSSQLEQSDGGPATRATSECRLGPMGRWHSGALKAAGQRKAVWITQNTFNGLLTVL